MLLHPSILNAADRLATIVMAIVDAISPIILTGTPAFPVPAAQTLFLRLARLVTTLIRINNFGIRAKPAPTLKTPIKTAAPSAKRPDTAQRLPTHPGWLLAALPDIAPAVASDLAALLADRHVTALLAATPTLYRTLRPLLRALDLGLNPPPQPDPPQRTIESKHRASSPKPVIAGLDPATQGGRHLASALPRTARSSHHLLTL